MTSNGRRPASVKRVASSVRSTLKSSAAPICVIAVRPASIASVWRKPVVRENTSTSTSGAAPSTVTVPVIAPWNLHWNV